jgi:hypothetical protein
VRADFRRFAQIMALSISATFGMASTAEYSGLEKTLAQGVFEGWRRKAQRRARNAYRRSHGSNSMPVPGGGTKERLKWARRFAAGTTGHLYVGATAA